jgi:hypothetical protein
MISALWFCGGWILGLIAGRLYQYWITRDTMHDYWKRRR